MLEEDNEDILYDNAEEDQLEERTERERFHIRAKYFR